MLGARPVPRQRSATMAILKEKGPASTSFMICVIYLEKKVLLLELDSHHICFHRCDLSEGDIREVVRCAQRSLHKLKTYGVLLSPLASEAEAIDSEGLQSDHQPVVDELDNKADRDVTATGERLGRTRAAEERTAWAVGAWTALRLSIHGLLKKFVIQKTKELTSQHIQVSSRAKLHACAVCSSTRQTPSDSSDSKMGAISLLQCSRCKSTAYCSKNHQKEHWPQHKVAHAQYYCPLYLSALIYCSSLKLECPTLQTYFKEEVPEHASTQLTKVLSSELQLIISACVECMKSCVLIGSSAIHSGQRLIRTTKTVLGVSLLAACSLEILADIAMYIGPSFQPWLIQVRNDQNCFSYSVSNVNSQTSDHVSSSIVFNRHR